MTEQKLTIIEVIRKRPAMFVGELSFLGVKAAISFLLNDILENASGKAEILVEINKGDLISIKVEELDTSNFIENIKELESTEFKYLFFGLPLLVALSEKSEVFIQNPPDIIGLHSKFGAYQWAVATAPDKKKSFKIDFKIDQNIFRDVKVEYEIINQLLRKYAHIYNCRIISSNNTTSPAQTVLFDYPKGISHLLDYKLAEEIHGVPFLRMDLNTTFGGHEYQISMAYLDWLGQGDIMTFANATELFFGGSLEKGILDGMKAAFKEYAAENQIEISTKKIREQLILLAVAKGKDFNFVGSTKLELGMPAMRKGIKEFVSQQMLHYLRTNGKAGKNILSKFEKLE